MFRLVGKSFVVILAFCLSMTWLNSLAQACPFCSAQSQTFSEEIASMDVVVIAKLVKVPPPPKSDSPNEPVPKALFEITDVIKGKSHLGDGKTVETIYFGDGKPGKLFMITGIDPPKLMWSSPMIISERTREYLLQLDKVPKDGPARMAYFQEYLEHEDERLAQDAYDEFAKSPYATIIGLKSQMKHDQLVTWIKDTDIPASRRRLYLTMLGVCGQPEDAEMLEGMMRSTDRKSRAGLDALIACYLMLKGPQGMSLIEDLYLKNDKSDYADTYSAIMALRFHGTEANVIPKPRLLEGLRHMLNRPQLADLVIPDLARWEDWSQMDRLVKLFKEADDKSSWVRVPVVNFLRACPLPEAKEKIKELEKIDAGAVKRAQSFFPLAPTPTPPAPKTSRIEAKAIVPVASVQEKPQSAPPQERAAPPQERVTKSELRQVASASRDARVLPLVRSASGEKAGLFSPNRIRLIGVTWLLGAIIMLFQWTILRGRSVA